MQKQFENYEQQVIPLLSAYGGKLEAVLRPNKSVKNTPDEIHFVSFSSQADFEEYKTDPNRLQFSEQFQQAVKEIQLFEGENLMSLYI